MGNEIATSLARWFAGPRAWPLSPLPLTYAALLQRAIKQIVASSPVYRTYVDLSGSPAEDDRHDIAWAITRARRSDPDVHPSAFDFLQNLLLGETEKPPTQD